MQKHDIFAFLTTNFDPLQKSRITGIFHWFSSHQSFCCTSHKARGSEVDYRVPRATMFLASTHDNLTERDAVVMRLVQGLQPTWRHSKAKVSTSRIFENGLLMIFIWIVSVNKAPMWLLFCGTRRLFVLYRVCARCDILLGKHFRCDLWYTAKLRYKILYMTTLPASLQVFPSVLRWKMTLLLNRLFMHWTDNYSDVIVYYPRHVITSIAC